MSGENVTFEIKVIWGQTDEVSGCNKYLKLVNCNKEISVVINNTNHISTKHNNKLKRDVKTKDLRPEMNHIPS